MTDDQRVQRLALHLGLTTMMLQQGTPLSMLQQQLLTLRSAAKDVIDIEDIPPATRFRVEELIPDTIAAGLCEDVAIPDDISTIDTDPGSDA